MCVPADFRLTADEIAYVISDSGVRAVVVHGALAQTVGAARQAAGHRGPCLVYGGRLASAEDYALALSSASPQFDAPPPNYQAAAIIMHTSAAVGGPKGAVLTHRNLVMHGPRAGTGTLTGTPCGSRLRQTSEAAHWP